MSPVSTTVIRMSRLGWCCLALGLLAPWLLVAWMLRSDSAPALRAIRPPAHAAAQATPAHSGPWGQLDSSRILIEPPEDFVPPFYLTAQPLRWTFTGATDITLSALWQAAGLSPLERQALDQPARREVTATGIVLQPDRELVLALSPEARAKIYAVLAAFPENPPQFDPFRGGVGAKEDWFDEAALPADVVALTRRMFYRRGNVVLFSDHDLVLPLLTDPADRIRYIKVLARKSALLVQVHVHHNTDVNALAAYWGQGRRSKDVRPILESLAQRPAGGTIDIVHLLPPFARALLYTYPVPPSRAVDLRRDCHWTSFNFYNSQPDDRFANLELVQETILNEFYPTSGAPALGDIVMLMGAGERGVHSCVYIADDIVFTKNGPSFSTPWQLARLENVIEFYSLTGPLEVRRYRRRQ